MGYVDEYCDVCYGTGYTIDGYGCYMCNGYGANSDDDECRYCDEGEYEI